MVAAFLRAEFDSRLFSSVRELAEYYPALRPAILTPNTDDQSENAMRGLALGLYRGFLAGTMLFQGFPLGVTWFRASLDRADLTTVRYARHRTWDALSGGSFVAGDAARRMSRGDVVAPVGSELARALAAIQQLVASINFEPDFPSFQELILVAEADGAPMIALEGHKRLTALLLAHEHRLPAEIPALVGYSVAMRQWALNSFQ